MTVINVTTDPEALTLTLVAEFDASPSRVWEVWEDPRQLEQWWGPPTYPSTFTRHDFVVDGESRYYMTGPGGDQPHGWWRINAIDKPHRLDFDSGLAGDDGEPIPDVLPMPSYVIFEAIDGRTRMTAVTAYVNVAQMEKMLAMGMKDGMHGAASQIDAILLK